MRKVRRLLKENWIPIVVGILLTKWAVDYAYRVRGYDAIGSEWLSLFITHTVHISLLPIKNLRQKHTISFERR